jgi:LPPG:FO 2-phospho-L-lactate transferase
MAVNAPSESVSAGGLRVVAIAGGVGGAKLVDGLAQIIPVDKLTIIANTGDDFQHMGLMVCPDLDTIMYTLAGAANAETGWGRAGETWHTMQEVARLGGSAWFRLGDLDLATHLVRTELLGRGATLTEATQHLCRHLGVEYALLPMSNEAAPTMIETEAGLVPFQTWFVQEQWQPAVKQVRLPEDVRASRPVLQALEAADVVVLAPSNPFVSIDPVLNVYPIRAMIADLPQAVAAVTPIVGGRAIKGPAAKMMREMGMPVTARAIADYYGELIDLFVYDVRDEGSMPGTGSRHDDDQLLLLATDTLMHTRADRLRLAREVIQFITELLDQ